MTGEERMDVPSHAPLCVNMQQHTERSMPQTLCVKYVSVIQCQYYINILSRETYNLRVRTN